MPSPKSLDNLQTPLSRRRTSVTGGSADYIIAMRIPPAHSPGPTNWPQGAPHQTGHPSNALPSDVAQRSGHQTGHSSHGPPIALATHHDRPKGPLPNWPPKEPTPNELVTPHIGHASILVTKRTPVKVKLTTSGHPSHLAPGRGGRVLLYKGYNETDLNMLVVHTENKSDAQSMEINRLRSEMQRKDTKVHEQSNQIVLLKAEKRMLDNQCRFRGGFGKHVSTFGGYLLARKLATSTTGAASCAQLVAGESHQGSVQCPHTVTTYVHRLFCGL